MTKQELYEKAKSLGIELPEFADITVAQLKELIATKEGAGDEEGAGTNDTEEETKPEAKVAGKTLQCLRPKGRVVVAGRAFSRGEKLTLSAGELKNEHLMKKVQHGVRVGLYKFV